MKISIEQLWSLPLIQYKPKNEWFALSSHHDPSLMRWQVKKVALTVMKTTARLTSPRELDGCELVRATRAARIPLKK